MLISRYLLSLYSSTRGGQRRKGPQTVLHTLDIAGLGRHKLIHCGTQSMMVAYAYMSLIQWERERERADEYGCSLFQRFTEWTQRIKQIRYPNTRIIVFRKRKFGLARKDLDMHTNVSSQKLAMILGSGCPTSAMMSSLPPNTWRIHMRIYTVMPKSETTLILNLLCVFIMVWVYWIEYCSCSSKIKTSSD